MAPTCTHVVSVFVRVCAHTCMYTHPYTAIHSYVCIMTHTFSPHTTTTTTYTLHTTATHPHPTTHIPHPTLPLHTSSARGEEIVLATEKYPFGLCYCGRLKERTRRIMDTSLVTRRVVTATTHYSAILTANFIHTFPTSLK